MDKPTRTYRSVLRDEQARRTRQLILEALVRVLANGIGSLSVPAVAREAGVSVPTVYRHFRTKEELLRGLGEHYAAQLHPPERHGPPSGPDDLLAGMRELYRSYERMEPELRAAMASDLGNEARSRMMPERLRWAEAGLGPAWRSLPPRDREKLRNVFLILSSSAAQRAFKDYFGIGADEAADHVAWVLRRLLAGIEGSRARTSARGGAR